MERVAEDACDAFLAWWDTGAACETSVVCEASVVCETSVVCEEHLADQLVLPLSLAAGESRWSVSQITEHLRTVLRVVEYFLPVESALDEQAGGSGLVTLRGV